jgi:hypothetical protein
MPHSPIRLGPHAAAVTTEFHPADIVLRDQLAARGITRRIVLPRGV